MRQPKSIRLRIKSWLPYERYAHTLRVLKAALKLARRYNANRKEVSIAALLHDAGRHVEACDMLKEAKKYGLRPSIVEQYHPKLIHARLGSAIARKVFKVRSKRVLSAIKSHTQGKSGMTLLEKIVYLADHIESSRRYKGAETARKLAYIDMDQAIAFCAGTMIRDLIKHK